MKKYIYISLFALTSAFTACSSLEESGVAEAVPFDGENIRLHTTIGGGTRIDVPSDNKTDWVKGDAIFFLVDGGSGDKGFKATYDGAKWSFAEWYKNGGTQDFNPAGGTVSFAMNGDNLNLATMKPSNLDVSKTALQTLTTYSGGKVGDLLFTSTGSYTVDENGVVDIFLNFTRPMAKIHVKGVYLAATQIRNHIEGTMPGGVDNAGGTNASQMRHQMGQGGGIYGSYDLYTYLVDENGDIDFPTIGKINVLGHTTRDVKHKLEEELSTLLHELPGGHSMVSCEVNIVNRSFSVIGAQSGRYTINKEKMTIFEALSMAGDLQEFNSRSEIKLVREINGVTTVKTFDARSKDIVNSEFYYIEPNDIIYIRQIPGYSFGINHVTTVIGVTASTISFGAFIWSIVQTGINHVNKYYPKTSN